MIDYPIIDDITDMWVEFREFAWAPCIFFAERGEEHVFLWWEEGWTEFNTSDHLQTNAGQVSAAHIQVRLKGLPPLPEPYESVLRRTLKKALALQQVDTETEAGNRPA